MGAIKQPRKVLLFFGVMYSDEKTAKKAVQILVEKFGKIVDESEEFAFDFTDFYSHEFGRDLKKRFVLFDEPIHREELAKIKVFANIVEEKFAKNGKRAVNLDPGYLSEHNLVLASCKEFPHRIYLGEGIYAEVEMMFKKGGAIEYPQYVYKDYQGDVAKKFFLAARELVKR